MNGIDVTNTLVQVNAPIQKSIFTRMPKRLHNPSLERMQAADAAANRKCYRSLYMMNHWCEFDLLFGPNLGKMYLEPEAF